LGIFSQFISHMAFNLAERFSPRGENSKLFFNNRKSY